jgi:hypothetical protein
MEERGRSKSIAKIILHKAQNKRERYHLAFETLVWKLPWLPFWTNHSSKIEITTNRLHFNNLK